ncbi:SDR family NAD(P)-dependent oxidoreductase [Heyndrickxia sp. NPDC080065]|uniref:SDR family NAD(P)-dependent oxidoreductase n=1 Tax=Heyndrickxia sp. NPDC080065 TaxID=3390568 RepID=UPI003CFF79F9
MVERIVIITGANSGIGKAATLKFATEGYTVIMACRNIEISKIVQKEIIEASKNEKVELMELDVSSFNSIRKFCSEYKNRYPKLDILIHNAAYMNHGEKIYQLSPENIELTFATNTFGPFLMTNLLLDYLAKSEDPRILNACTTNIKHFFDPKRKIDFDNLHGEFKESRPYSVYKMYGDSKMALLMLTFKMANEFKNSGIKVNALQINGVRMSKETIKKLRSFWKVIATIQNVYFPPPAEMANNYFHICTSDEFKNATGQLINHKREMIQPPKGDKDNLVERVKQIFGSSCYPRYATETDNIEKIWEISTQLTKN